jgi:hypothetical protein
MNALLLSIPCSSVPQVHQIITSTDLPHHNNPRYAPTRFEGNTHVIALCTPTEDAFMGMENKHKTRHGFIHKRLSVRRAQEGDWVDLPDV